VTDLEAAAKIASNCYVETRWELDGWYHSVVYALTEHPDLKGAARAKAGTADEARAALIKTARARW
jgi:hypothetical protein